MSSDRRQPGSSDDAVHGRADEAASGGVACRTCDEPVVPPGRFCVACGTPVDGDDARPPSPASDGASAEEDEHRPSAPATVVVAIEEPAGRYGDRPPPASGRRAMRPCPGCGADNVHDRVLCHACGSDLDAAAPGTAAPTGPSGPFTARPNEVETGRTRRRRWWRGLATVLLAVLGATIVAVAVLALTEGGPFADPDEPLEPVAFPADRYDEAPAPLPMADVATLTVRAPEGPRRFTPEAMVDGDATTAWHGDPGSLPPGTDETIDVTLAEPAWVTGIVLANGDHHDAEAYAASGRLRQVLVGFDGGGVVAATLLDQGRELQRIELTEPVLTTSVRIELLETVAGTENDDPALSRLELQGLPADAQDAALAEERASTWSAAGVVTVPVSP